MSAKLTIRIPRDLKERMERFRSVNWSEVVRKAIEERLREEEIRWALKVMDKISRKAKPRRASAEVIREFRDRR